MKDDDLKERFIIKDIQTGAYSNHTTIDGIFDLCSTSMINDVSSDQDKVDWKNEFKEYSSLDKKNFIEVNGYQLLEPTFNNIKEYEDAGHTFKSETELDFGVSRALYTFGRLKGEGLIRADEMDMDEIEEICLRLSNDWGNEVDITNSEEMGYPQPYMERRLLENYGTSLSHYKNVTKLNNRDLER